MVLDSSKEVRLINNKTQSYHEHGNKHDPGHEHPNSHGRLDPHLWLDVENDIKIITRIAGIFASKDPAGASYYAENAIAYNRKLSALDAKYKKELKHCRRSILTVNLISLFYYHP